MREWTAGQTMGDYKNKNLLLCTIFYPSQIGQFITWFGSIYASKINIVQKHITHFQLYLMLCNIL